MSFVIFTLFALFTMPIVACVCGTMIHLLVTCGEWLDANIPLEASVSIVDGKLTAGVVMDEEFEQELEEVYQMVLLDLRGESLGRKMDALQVYSETGSNQLPCMAMF